MHTHRHTLSNLNPRKLVRAYSTLQNKEIYTIHFDDDDSFTLDPQSKFKYPFEGVPRFYFRIVGSCNGLLCISDDLFGYTNNVILWNPAIRRRLVLPTPLGSLIDLSAQFMYALRFGFDPTNDYKVVRIAYVQKHGGYTIPPLVEIYSVNEGAWRGINPSSPPPVNCIVDFFWSQAFVNGAVHWVAYSQPGGHGDRVSSLIMSFDMSYEVFGEVMLPECLICESPINIHAAVVGDRLSVFQCDRLFRVTHGKCCSIWVMKEYGVVESWFKLCNIDLGVRSGRALDVRKNGEIFLGEFGGQLVSHDPKTKGYCNFEVFGSKGSIYVDKYRESLALYLEGDEIWDCASSDIESELSEDEEGVDEFPILSL